MLVVAEVGLSDGAMLDADALVNAAGTQADAVARLIGRILPLSPTRGLLVELSPVASESPSLPCILDPLLEPYLLDRFGFGPAYARPTTA